MLDELLTCGDTEVADANMKIVISKVCRPVDEGFSISGFQQVKFHYNAFPTSYVIILVIKEDSLMTKMITYEVGKAL